MPRDGPETPTAPKYVSRRGSNLQILPEEIGGDLDVSVVFRRPVRTCSDYLVPEGAPFTVRFSASVVPTSS